MDKTLQKYLRMHDIQATTLRMHIANQLFHKAQHLSAEQLMQQLRNAGISLSQATVYNTLGLFSAKGILRIITLEPGHIIYDTNTKPHFHFYNRDSGELIDLEYGAVTLSQLPSAPAGTTIADIDITIHLHNSNQISR